MSEHSLTANFKNVSHALTDVWPAKLVTTALNADLTTLLTLCLDSVLKFVEMERDILLNVMMKTTLMGMVAARIVELKSVSHASAVHQLPEIHAVLFYQLPFQYKTEDNQNFMGRLF